MKKDYTSLRGWYIIYDPSSIELKPRLMYRRGKHISFADVERDDPLYIALKKKGKYK